MIAGSLTVPAFPRADEYAGVWAMEPRAAAALWDATRRMDLKAHVAAGAPPLRSKLETQPDGRGKNVAVVRLEGTLMKAQSSLGGTSTAMARRDVRAAAADPDVSAILLAIDSPGGTVAGTDDLAADVRAAKGKKPVFAFVSDLCASAAYWVASQADAVYANSGTAMVGSIGTLMTMYDLSKAADAAGVEALVFATGSLKGAGTEGTPVTEEQRAYFQRIVDESQKGFDAAVMKGRGMSAAKLKAVRTGGVFLADEGTANGLIDGVQSYEATVAALAKEAYSRQRAGSQRGATMTETLSDVAPVAATTAPAPSAAALDVIALRKERADELRKMAAIQKVCAKHPDIAATAIEEGWSVEKAELASLKADLPKPGPAANPHGGHVNVGAGKFQLGTPTVGNGTSVNAALEAGVRMVLGRNVEKDYAPDVLQAAHENFRRVTLSQLFLTAAAANGYHAHVGERLNQGNLRTVLAHTLDNRSAGSASSTISLAGILGAVANKEILAGYMETDTAWQEIAAVKPVGNLQQHRSYRMTDDMEYEEIGADGLIKHGTAGEEYYTRQAKTFAKMFLLPRAALLNDDMGAFGDIRTRVGRGSNKKFNKVFWSAFVNNAAFFTALRTNYIEGATTNLGTDGVGVGKAVLAFRKMTSPAADGAKHVNADTQNPVGSSPGGRPEILLCPPELEGNAEVTYRNQNLGAVKSADANIYQGKYRPVVAWQLSDPAYTGFSSAAWYLFNNPSYLAPMVVSFLDGQVAPTVEAADADFDQLGVQFRGYHDFGCDQAEYLAGLKVKGAA